MNTNKNIPLLTITAADDVVDVVPKVAEAIPQNIGVVYNAYSLDAVITAAFMQTTLRERSFGSDHVFAHQSNQVSPVVLGEYDHIYWVGVTPSKSVAITSDVVLELPKKNLENPVPECLFHEAVTLLGKDKQSYWRAALLIEAFNAMDKNIPMEVQVWLYSNFQEALNCLAVKKNFQFVAPDSDGFWRQLGHLKNQMRQMTKVLKVTVEGKTAQIPVINCQPWLAPWVSRLASLLWGTVLIADHTWDGVVWHGVSREFKNVDTIINKLSKIKNDKLILANAYKV